MSEAKLIKAAKSGARFYRVDLHIHSFGPDGTGSADVTDSAMTPEAIVATALLKGLGAIAVTDHNTIGNVERAIRAGAGKSILIVPGVELTTPGGHLLVYAESPQKLSTMLARLRFNKDRSACQTSMSDALHAVAEVGGLAIAAHIDLESGIEAQISGYGDPKESVICSSTLVALEIANASSLTWFTDRDDVQARAQLAKKRVDVLNDSFVRSFPKVRFSDAHKLANLGRNYELGEKLTRLKLAELDWVSLKRAFADPDARVRLEDEVPTAIPHFVGMTIKGGFLNGQTFGFSRNLTCIIGGRGSGKSTAFQSLCAAAGTQVDDELTKADVWPEQIDAVYQDEFGTEKHLRVTGTERIDINDVLEDAPHIPIETLSQGDVTRLIERCRTNPGALLSFLDDLANVTELKQKRNEAQAAVAANGQRILQLQSELSELDTLKQTLEGKNKQMAAAKTANGAELVAKQQQVAKAVSIRKRLMPTFDGVLDSIAGALSDDQVAELAQVAEESKQLTDVPAQSPLPTIVDELRQRLQRTRTDLLTWRKDSERKIREYGDACHRVQQKLQTEIQEKVTELRQKNIPLDAKETTALATDIEKLSTRIATLARKEEERKSLLQARPPLLRAFRQAHDAIGTARELFAKRVTDRLQTGMQDEMKFSLKFKPGGVSLALQTALVQVMGWRTAAIPKAPALVSALGAARLTEAILTKDTASLIEAKQDGVAIISRNDAEELVRRVGDFATRRQFEESAYEDLPWLRVAKPRVDKNGSSVLNAEGKPQWDIREFAQLSLGQQQAIVLGILLLSDLQTPLLIDQPEDNLDSAFIFRVLVGTLRSIKERRQVILVTHSANIGVLSDSDLIIPLKASADRSSIVLPGSVEANGTRDLVCEILEGGRAAYTKRGTLYNLR